MSTLRRILSWFGAILATLCIVASLRHLIVVPTAEQGSVVRILNPDQVVVAKPSEVLGFTLTLRNSGSDPVEVTGCEAGCSCTTPVGLPLTLNGNSDCNLSFQLKAGNIEGSVVHQEIRVYTVPPIPDLVANVISQVETRSPTTAVPE